MIIVYYRNADGKILECHGTKDSITLQQLYGMADEYNRAKGGKKTVYIEETTDDSITAYLFRKAMERRQWDKETINEVVNAIEEALDLVRGLE